MASSEPSLHREVLGSGGKVLRGRRRSVQKHSPYNRPLSSPAPVDEQIGRNRDWLGTIISGVRKLFLSVVDSEDDASSSSECSSDHSSEEFYHCSPDEYDEEYLSDDLTVFKLKESAVDRNIKTLSIVPKSETKLVIEQLLMQETFTRDECSKLVKIIQSRALNTSSSEFDEGTQSRNIYGTSDLSPTIPTSFSPRFNSYDVAFCDLRNKAVMEAKKWFEERKVSPSHASDRISRPYDWGYRLNPYNFEGEGASPIEMAKSYMQSLTPSTSPSFDTIGIKTPASHMRNTYNFEFCSLSASEDFRKAGQSKSFSRLSEREASSMMPSTAACTRSDVHDKCLDLHEGGVAGADQPMETKNNISASAIFLSDEASKEQLQYDTVRLLPNDADMPIISDASQNVEMLVPNEEQMSGVSEPRDPLIFASIADTSFPATEDLQLESITPAEPSNVPEANTMKSFIELSRDQSVMTSDHGGGPAVSDVAQDQSSMTHRGTNIKPIEKNPAEPFEPSKGKRKTKMVAKHRRLRG